MNSSILFLDYRPKNSIMCYQCEGRLDSETCQKVTFCDLDKVRIYNRWLYVIKYGLATGILRPLLSNYWTLCSLGFGVRGYGYGV